jgi:hypothetical protein
MATHRANGPTRVTDADPLEQPSLPLTTADRESVQADLDQQRDLLERHANTEPLTGMVAGWSKRYWAYVREIARLERMLEEDA